MKTLITIAVSGSLRGAGQLDPGPWLEAIADRLQAGAAPAVAYIDVAGERRHATLDPATVEVGPATITATVEAEHVTQPAPNIRGAELLAGEIDEYAKRLRDQP